MPQEAAEATLHPGHVEASLSFLQFDVVHPDDFLAAGIHHLLVQHVFRQACLFWPEAHGGEVGGGAPQADGGAWVRREIGHKLPGKDPFLSVGPAQAELCHLGLGPEGQDHEILQAPDGDAVGVHEGTMAQLGEGEGAHGEAT